MDRRILEVCTIPALAALFFFAVARCALAQEANPGASIDLFGGRVVSIESSDGHSNSYGVREVIDSAGFGLWKEVAST